MVGATKLDNEEGIGRSKPVALAYVDVDGTLIPISVALPLPITGGGGGGSGTEYTEDAAAAANPVGGALILVRRDTLTVSEVSTDGDNVAAKATSKGELVTRDADAIAQLVLLAGYLDGVEGFVDGLETLITSTNTKLNGGLPAALAAGGGLKVEGVAGGVAQPVSGPMTSTEFLANMRSTTTHSSVNSGTSSVTILASNSARKGATIRNSDANALHLDLSGGTATVDRAHKTLLQNESCDVPSGMTNAITGIWAADGSGVAAVAEFA